MNKLFFCIQIGCLFTCFYKVSGQVSFLDSTYFWTERTYGGFQYTSYVMRYTYSASPTKFDGKTYYEKLGSVEENGDNWEHTFEYYRNDTLNKIWMFATPEILVYDFNLNPNDSFKIDPETFLVVDHIDTIILLNGELRKRLAMRCSFDEDPTHGWGYDYWIEGIGGTRGIGVYPVMEQCHIDGFGYETLCISRNDTLIYMGTDSCWYTPVAVQEPLKESLRLYPNPTEGLSEIDGVKDFIRLSIWNSTGSLIQTQNSKSIDLQNEPPGLYVIKIESSSFPVIFRFLIKT